MIKEFVMAAAERRAIIGVYPGSFDPVTVSHVSVAERAARNLDKLYVAVAVNPEKKGLFTPEQKTDFVTASIGHIANAEAIAFDGGLTATHSRQLGARTMIRGSRSVTDFLDEINLFGQNIYVQACDGIEPGDEEFVDTQTYYALGSQDHVSSSLVRGFMVMRNVAKADRIEKIKPLVPEVILDEVIAAIPCE
jgi:pantetheine-phosphate adenylyltransferase